METVCVRDTMQLVIASVVLLFSDFFQNSIYEKHGHRHKLSVFVCSMHGLICEYNLTTFNFKYTVEKHETK